MSFFCRAAVKRAPAAVGFLLSRSAFHPALAGLIVRRSARAMPHALTPPSYLEPVHRPTRMTGVSVAVVTLCVCPRVRSRPPSSCDLALCSVATHRRVRSPLTSLPGLHAPVRAQLVGACLRSAKPFFVLMRAQTLGRPGLATRSRLKGCIS